jgi:hypothetical protein
MAGLWKRDLTRGLQWEKRSNKRHLKVLQDPYIAPSWSWAASDVDIYYPRAQLKELSPEYEVQNIRMGKFEKQNLYLEQVSVPL